MQPGGNRLVFEAPPARETVMSEGSLSSIHVLYPRETTFLGGQDNFDQWYA